MAIHSVDDIFLHSDIFYNQRSTKISCTLLYHDPVKIQYNGVDAKKEHTPDESILLLIALMRMLSRKSEQAYESMQALSCNSTTEVLNLN